MLYLGVRRGDVVTLGRQHVKDGWLRLVPRKTRYKRLEVSEKPVLPVLAEVIAASPLGDMTFLVTEYARPFTAKGFGAWFRARCDEADLPNCTAHGLRKAGATIAAENGATDRQSHGALRLDVGENTANVYTAAADRKRLASEAAKLVAGENEAGKSKVPLIVPLPISQWKTRGNCDDWQECQDSNLQPPVLERPRRLVPHIISSPEPYGIVGFPARHGTKQSYAT